MLFLFLGITSLFAQQKVPNLQDLIGVKGRSAEAALEKRGYTYIKTDKSGGSAYSNWWHGVAKKCVSIRISNGVVKSAVYAPPFDCNKKDSKKNVKPVSGKLPTTDLSSLVGMKARWLDEEMNKRGYRLKNGNKSGGSSYSNYWNERQKRCVTARVSDGVVRSITKTATSKCSNSGSSGGSGGGYGGGTVKVDYLEGWKALRAYDELRSKGFHEVKKHTANGKTYRVWYNNRTRQCIKTLSKNERIAEVMKSTHCDNR